jgi:hypothetical protein
MLNEGSSGATSCKPIPCVDSSRAVQLGTYQTPEGRRELLALDAGDRLCVIDQHADGELLVEPDLEDMGEARAVADDYLSLARAAGEPQTRHPFVFEAHGQAVAGRSAS